MATTEGMGRSVALAIITLVALVLFAPGAAEATSLSPLTFEISANPGETITNYVTVYNNDGYKTSYFMSAEDFAPVGEEGNVVIEEDAPAAISAKKWLTFEPNTVEMSPGESKDIKFTLNVPLDAEPGGKYTSILVSTAPNTDDGGGAVAIASKVASLLLIRVAGPVSEKITVQSFEAPPMNEYGPIAFALRLKNEGTVHLKPVGFVFVKNWLGNEIVKLPLPQQRVIPSTTRLVNIVWPDRWLLGKYTANFAGIYGIANEPLAASVTFWVIPWRILGTALLGILIIVLIAWKMRRRISLALSILFKGQN